MREGSGSSQLRLAQNLHEAFVGNHIIITDNELEREKFKFFRERKSKERNGKSSNFYSLFAHYGSGTVVI